jgi:hypothetical protein
MSYLYAKANKIPIDDFKKMLRNLDSDEWWLFIYELGRIENKKNSDPDMEKMRKDNISFLTKDLLNKLK